MAMSSGKWWSTFTFISSAGIKVVREYEHYDTDWQWIIPARDALAFRLQALTKMTLMKIETSLVTVEESLTLPSGAFPEDVLLLTCPIKGDARSVGSISIPAPVQSAFMATTGSMSEQVKVDQVAIEQLLNMFDQPYFYLSDHEQIDHTIVSGKRVHRKTIGL